MSKPAKSSLVESFMDLADNGVIRAEDGNHEAEGTLFKVYLALHSILNGENPDVALEITRTKGVSQKPHSLTLALLIHFYKYEEKQKWVVVENKAEEWLIENGHPVVKLAGLKRLYNRHRAEVEKIVSRRDCVLMQRPALFVRQRRLGDRQ